MPDTGDNLFYHTELERIMENACSSQEGAVIFGNWVEDPRPFGVVEFDSNGTVLSLKKNRKFQNPIILYRVFIFMIPRRLKSQNSLNHPHGANLRLRM